MPRETFDDGVDAAIAAVENLMDRCVKDCEALSDPPDALDRHRAHRVAYYDALTALEEIRRGEDGCKLRFIGTRAERLQEYLIERAEAWLRQGGDSKLFLPHPADVNSNEEFANAVLVKFLGWLRQQVKIGSIGRARQLEK